MEEMKDQIEKKEQDEQKITSENSELDQPSTEVTNQPSAEVTDQQLMNSDAPKLHLKNKKKIIISVISIIMVIAVILTSIYVIAPAVQYSTADKAFNNGEYEIAKEKFEALGDYKDSTNRLVTVGCAIHYTNGLSALEEKKYDNAIDEFKQANGFKDAEEKIMECGKAFLKANEYKKAQQAFEETTGKNHEQYYAYASGLVEMENAEFEKAETHFSEAGKIENAPNMVLGAKLCQAEMHMKNGYLNSALKILKKLPKNFSYNGKKVSERLSKINRHKDFVALCGEWSSSKLNFAIRSTHKSTGLWDEWYADASGVTCVVTCVINEDDTVTMRVVAEYPCYENFSTLSSNLRTDYPVTTFRYTGKTVPSKITNEDGSISISGKKFSLTYRNVDANYSLDFTYTRTASGTYNKLVEAY